MLNDADDEESKGYLQELEEAAARSGWESLQRDSLSVEIEWKSTWLLFHNVEPELDCLRNVTIDERGL